MTELKLTKHLSKLSCIFSLFNFNTFCLKFSSTWHWWSCEASPIIPEDVVGEHIVRLVLNIYTFLEKKRISHKKMTSVISITLLSISIRSEIDNIFVYNSKLRRYYFFLIIPVILYIQMYVWVRQTICHSQNRKVDLFSISYITVIKYNGFDVVSIRRGFL